MLKSVVFDFDGTLASFTDADELCLKALYSQCRAKCSESEFIDQAVEEIIKFHSLVSNGQIDALLMHEVRLKNLFKSFSLQWDDKYLRFYKELLISHTKPYKGVVELLTGIKKRGIKLGLISNAYDYEEQYERIKNSYLEKFFDEIVISGEVGAAKPDPEIFKIMLEKLNLLPEESVYIGDTEKYDIKGANNAGMHSILICRNNSYTSPTADFTCHNISDLKEKIDKLLMV